jgi:hypothetical protein
MPLRLDQKLAEASGSRTHLRSPRRARTAALKAARTTGPHAPPNSNHGRGIIGAMREAFNFSASLRQTFFVRGPSTSGRYTLHSKRAFPVRRFSRPATIGERNPCAPRWAPANPPAELRRKTIARVPCPTASENFRPFISIPFKL